MPGFAICGTLKSQGRLPALFRRFLRVEALLGGEHLADVGLGPCAEGQ